MLLTIPFKRHLIVYALTLTCITSYLSLKEESNHKTASFFIDQNISDEFALFNNIATMKDTWPNKFIKKHDIYILGLFELTTKFGLRPEGRTEVAAAKLAIKHVNNMKILPYYNLKLLINDTKVCIQFQVK